MTTVRGLALWAIALAIGGASAEAHAQGFDSDSAWLGSKGFYHRAAGAVVHADRRAIEERRERSVTALLESFDRIEVRPGAGGGRAFVLHDSAGWEDRPDATGCTLAIYINGGRLRQPNDMAAGRAVDRAVQVRSLDALEIHDKATSPTADPDACGAVLLWSYSLSRSVDHDFTGRLRGRAHYVPDNVPAGGIEVRLEPGGLVQRTDSGGWFEFGRLAAGLYQITATSPSGATWSERLLIRAFAISQIEIDVERETGEVTW